MSDDWEKLMAGAPFVAGSSSATFPSSMSSPKNDYPRLDFLLKRSVVGVVSFLSVSGSEYPSGRRGCQLAATATTSA